MINQEQPSSVYNRNTHFTGQHDSTVINCLVQVFIQKHSSGSVRLTSAGVLHHQVQCPLSLDHLKEFDWNQRGRDGGIRDSHKLQQKVVRCCRERSLRSAPIRLHGPEAVSFLAAAFGQERVCDERRRAARLNIDEVGWKTARERSAVEPERAAAFSSVANYSCNYNGVPAAAAAVSGESHRQRLQTRFV